MGLVAGGVQFVTAEMPVKVSPAEFSSVVKWSRGGAHQLPAGVIGATILAQKHFRRRIGETQALVRQMKSVWFARSLGPVFAGTLFFVDVRLPYLICGGAALLTGLFAWKYLCGDKSPGTFVVENKTATD